MRMRTHNVYVAALVFLLASTAWVDAAGSVYVEDTDRFPGWKGELPNPSRTRPDGANVTAQPGMGVSFGEPQQV